MTASPAVTSLPRRDREEGGREHPCLYKRLHAQTCAWHSHTESGGQWSHSNVNLSRPQSTPLPPSTQPPRVHTSGLAQVLARGRHSINILTKKELRSKGHSPRRPPETSSGTRGRYCTQAFSTAAGPRVESEQLSLLLHRNDFSFWNKNSPVMFQNIFGLFRCQPF